MILGSLLCSGLHVLVFRPLCFLSLRANGTLVREPPISFPLRRAIFPTRHRANGNFQRIALKMAFSLYRVGKIACRRG